jgi:hypothetical protein
MQEVKKRAVEVDLELMDGLVGGNINTANMSRGNRSRDNMSRGNIGNMGRENNK